MYFYSDFGPKRTGKREGIPWVPVPHCTWYQKFILGTNNTIFELENRDENENLQIQND